MRPLLFPLKLISSDVADSTAAQVCDGSNRRAARTYQVLKCYIETEVFQMQDLLFDAVPLVEGRTNWFTRLLATLKPDLRPAWPDGFGVALHQWFHQTRHQPIRTLSLFSGGGGLDIGFHDAGFHALEMLELSPKYAATLEFNTQRGGLLQGAKVVCGDIRDYSVAATLEVDFIIGGPPCQTFSAAGRRAAGVMGTDDSRGTLFLEYVRLLKSLRPKGFLFENVYGITGAGGGEAWNQIQLAFREAGYTLHWRVLDAADYGVPQHRERLFIVGVRDGESPFLFPAPTHGPDAMNSGYYDAGTALIGLDTDAPAASVGLNGRYGRLLSDVPPGLNYSFFTAEMGHPFPVFSWRSKFSDFLYKADPNMPIRTLKAQGGQYTGPFHWDNRKFSIAELKRLQTFPDMYRLIGGEQVCIQQLGNSVPPQLARVLALAVLEQVFQITPPAPIGYLQTHEELGFRGRKRLLTAHYAATAKAALERMRRAGQLQPMPISDYNIGSETRVLGEDFSWTTTASGATVHLEYALDGQEWQIRAGALASENAAALELRLTPRAEYPWVLDALAVRLQVTDTLESSFTALWKAFEARLLEVTGTADLVQLSGYYQYQTRIKIDVLQHPDGVFWTLLSAVLSGVGVARQWSSAQFALAWGCDEHQVPSFMAQLKTVGYEIRNANTNPQIAVGEYLIPYAFPTLKPQSVQLRKSLEVTLAS